MQLVSCDGMTLTLNKYTFTTICTRIFSKAGDTVDRVSVEFVIGMSRGSAWWSIRGMQLPGWKANSSTEQRDWKNVVGMRDIRPSMYRRYKPRDRRSGGRWWCPSATRLHIGEFSAGLDPRDRCDAAISRRRAAPESGLRTPTNFLRGGGEPAAKKDTGARRTQTGGRRETEQRTTRGGGKDGRGRWCEDRTIVCLLTAISSQ